MVVRDWDAEELVPKSSRLGWVVEPLKLGICST